MPQITDDLSVDDQTYQETIPDSEDFTEMVEENINEEQVNGETFVMESNVTEEKSERITKLPLARIKHIMKMDPEVSLASQEAVFLISKSTELFVQTLAKESHQFTAQNKKKTVQKKDIESAISNCECLVFLEGALDV